VDSQWKIENDVATLYKESNAKKALREGLRLIKCDENMQLNFQLNKKTTVEVFILNKEITCYLGAVNSNYKIMNIITEDEIMKYIEENLQYLNRKVEF
jgi:hypothetical protein